MKQLLIISFSSIVAIFATMGLFYECLCTISRLVQRMTIKPRMLMYITVMGIFIAHSAAVLFYAIIYWVLIHFLGFSDLSGNIQGHFSTYLYFSITTYSSLGVGDVFPVHSLRFLSGIEAINGLILITWSAAFTFFSVQKMRQTHGLE